MVGWGTARWRVLGEEEGIEASRHRGIEQKKTEPRMDANKR